MKRSEINAALRAARLFFQQMHFAMPPLAAWHPDEFTRRGTEIDEILTAGLGWDITDFGLGDFARQGLLLFTIRNGVCGDPRYPKPYAEKIMIAQEDQITPMHFHWHKAEDIINRGGGNLVIKLYNATPDDRLADTPIAVSMDGVRHTLPAGSEIILKPGESITLPQRLYHSFWGQPGHGTVLVGEVSAVNDDHHDNRFLDELPRFPGIEEDEPPLHLLVSDYAALRAAHSSR